MVTGQYTSALEKLLHPLSHGFTAELASALVQLQADEPTQVRYSELADKANEGMLSQEERMELDALVEANTFLGILKAEAQVFLNQRAA